MCSRVLFGLSLAIGAFIGLAAIPHAVWAGCETTITTSVNSRYVLQDLGIVASRDPGLVTDLALSCPGPLDGIYTIDWWKRTDLRGVLYGKEQDFTATGAWKLGDYTLEASAAYFAIGRFTAADDHVVQLYADLGRTFDLGWASVTPAIRPIQLLGIDAFPAHTMLRARAPITFQLDALPLAGVSFTIDPSVTRDFNATPGQPRTIIRPTASLDWTIDKQNSLSLVGKAVNRQKQFEVSWTHRF